MLLTVFKKLPVSGRLKAVTDAVAYERPVFVGLSVIHTPLLKEDIEISKAVKKLGVPVVWGGVYTSVFPEMSLSADYVDYIVCGEGEETASELAKAIMENEPPQNISGVGYKDGGELKISCRTSFIDELDNYSPAWELVDIESYVEPYSDGDGRLMKILLSRGCPYRCAFCYNQTNPARRKFRIHSEEWVADQVSYIKEKTGMSMVRWVGDNNFGSMKKGMEIIGSVGLPWVSTARIEKIDDDFCKWAKESLCSHLGFGFESGSEKVLEILQKDTTRDVMRRGAAKLGQYGIFHSATWIHLIPGETEDDRRETREFMDEIYKIGQYVMFDMQGLRPYPGTHIWPRSLEAGLVPEMTNEAWARYENFMAPLFGWTEKRLQRLVALTRILYGRPFVSSALVPKWQSELLKKRYLRGKFAGPVEDVLSKKRIIRKSIVDS
jgi:radical SAM superfamily enzyme YgiQ (UPF0313 family)